MYKDLDIKKKLPVTQHIVGAEILVDLNVPTGRNRKEPQDGEPNSLRSGAQGVLLGAPRWGYGSSSTLGDVTLASHLEKAGSYVLICKVQRTSLGWAFGIQRW